MLRLEARWLTDVVKTIFSLQDRIELADALDVMMDNSKQSHEKQKTGQRGLFDLFESDAPNELTRIDVRPVRLPNQELFDFLAQGGLPELIWWADGKAIRFSAREVARRNQHLIDALNGERHFLGGYMWHTPIDLVIALGYLETAHKGMINERTNQRTP